MKIRNGFVSNSSSSSFIIACKGDLTKEVMKQLCIDKSSPWADFVEKGINLLIENATEKFTTIKELEQFIESDGYDDDAFDTLKEYIKQGFTGYIGSLDSDGDGIESALCDMEINYKSNDLIIEKEEGY